MLFVGTGTPELEIILGSRRIFIGGKDLTRCKRFRSQLLHLRNGRINIVHLKAEVVNAELEMTAFLVL